MSMTSARTTIVMVCTIALPVLALLGSGWTRYLNWGSEPTESHSRANSHRTHQAPQAAPQTGLAQMIQGQHGQAPRRAPSVEVNSPDPTQPSHFPHSPSIKRLPPPDRVPTQSADRGGTSFGGPTAHLSASFEAGNFAAGEAGSTQGVVQASSIGELPTTLPRPPAPSGTAARRAPAEMAEQPLRLGNERSVRPAEWNSGARGSADWFSEAAQRLRDLGATYYLLETWGRNGELYRFHCKMAVAGSQSYTRHFEATSADAAQAMRMVLEQVEAWRRGRSR